MKQKTRLRIQTDIEETIERILKKGEKHDYLNATSYYFDRSIDRRPPGLAVQPGLELLSKRRNRDGASCADYFDGAGPDLIRSQGKAKNF